MGCLGRGAAVPQGRPTTCPPPRLPRCCWLRLRASRTLCPSPPRPHPQSTGGRTPGERGGAAAGMHRQQAWARQRGRPARRHRLNALLRSCKKSAGPTSSSSWSSTWRVRRCRPAQQAQRSGSGNACSVHQPLACAAEPPPLILSLPPPSCGCPRVPAAVFAAGAWVEAGLIRQLDGSRPPPPEGAGPLAAAWASLYSVLAVVLGWAWAWLCLFEAAPGRAAACQCTCQAPSLAAVTLYACCFAPFFPAGSSCPRTRRGLRRSCLRW